MHSQTPLLNRITNHKEEEFLTEREKLRRMEEDRWHAPFHTKREIEKQAWKVWWLDQECQKYDYLAFIAFNQWYAYIREVDML